MMQGLALERCFNHSQREAVARCPSCRHYFCRECITEHEERVICANCLRKLATASVVHRHGFVRAGHIAQCIAGLLLAWFFFYLIGEALLAIPTAFHDEKSWKASSGETE
jgi:hypothetical protein